MNISNKSGSYTVNADNANSVQNNNTDENGTNLDEQIRRIHNAAVGLATLHYGFLAIGLMLFFVGAPLTAFMPLFILVGVTGLLLIGLAPFANSNVATRLLGGETHSPAPQTQEVTPQDMSEEAPGPSTSLDADNEERHPPPNQDNYQPRLRFAVDPRESQGGGEDKQHVIHETKL